MGKLRIMLACLAVLGLVLGVGSGHALAQKSGDGGEPGAGCTDRPNEGKQYQYNAPLFTGTLTADWVGNPPIVRSRNLQPGQSERGTVYISGRIEQIDNPGCYAEVNKLPFREGFLFMDFLQMKPEHIRQACIRADAFELKGDCYLNGWFMPSTYWEVLGVTDMIGRLHTRYTANVLLMGMNQVNLPCPDR